MTVPTSSVMEPDAFKRWVKASKPGDRIIYYTGHLAHDREGLVSVINPDSTFKLVRHLYQPLHDLGSAAYQAWTDGKVHLLQKRTGDATWFYIAERRKTR